MTADTLTPQQIAAEVLRRIRDEPEHHSQATWAWDGKTRGYEIADIEITPDTSQWPCGMTLCAGGHTVAVAAGETIHISSGSSEGDYVTQSAIDAYGLHLDAVGWHDSEGGYHGCSIPDDAQEALGLEDGAAAWLFDPDRTGAEVQAMLSDIADGMPVPSTLVAARETYDGAAPSEMMSA